MVPLTRLDSIGSGEAGKMRRDEYDRFHDGSPTVIGDVFGRFIAHYVGASNIERRSTLDVCTVAAQYLVCIFTTGLAAYSAYAWTNEDFLIGLSMVVILIGPVCQITAFQVTFSKHHLLYQRLMTPDIIEYKAFTKVLGQLKVSASVQVVMSIGFSMLWYLVAIPAVGRADTAQRWETWVALLGISLAMTVVCSHIFLSLATHHALETRVVRYLDDLRAGKFEHVIDAIEEHARITDLLEQWSGVFTAHAAAVGLPHLLSGILFLLSYFIRPKTNWVFLLMGITACLAPIGFFLVPVTRINFELGKVKSEINKHRNIRTYRGQYDMFWDEQDHRDFVEYLQLNITEMHLAGLRVDYGVVFKVIYFSILGVSSLVNLQNYVTKVDNIVQGAVTHP